MDPIIAKAKVMRNFTICISKPIRNELELEEDDYVILSMNERGEVRMIKARDDWGSLKGIAKETFKKLGGGEKFLKEERKSWDL